MVVAKFKTFTNMPLPDGASITLYPVVGDSPENNNFYKWTPGGSVILSIVNPNAAEQFVTGEEKFIVFMSPEEYKAKF